MLHELQTNFLKGIYDSSVENEAYPYLLETVEKTAEQQLSIYRGSIFGGLKKALAETYPVTKELVGEDFFNMMLAQYIKSYPCQVQDLNDYGEELPKLIKNLKQARSLPYLSDVTQLEWFCNIALNTKVQKNNLSDLSFLNTREKSQLKLKLPNGCVLLQSNYPIDKIWNYHQNDSEDELEIIEELINLVVWKNEHGLRIGKLSIEEFYFLERINSDITFVEVCRDLENSYPYADINLIFDNALQHGWLQSYEI